ncbi:hypothetical protein FKM82_012645 [Ascaphus truei]
MEVAHCLTLKDLVSTKKFKADMVMDGRSSQKENVFERYRISPRTPLKAEPIDLSRQKGYTPERIPITPVKVLERPQTDPWTPTANLKMLISAASPEIRDREKKKELFRPIENNEQEDVVSDSQQFDGVDDVDELEKRPSRKQKSLGLLCQKFLARYPSFPISTEKTPISLDEAASSLGVERRRIYDIVNVLESLQLVSRVAKNQYCWHGRQNLNETLKSLQRIGEGQKYEEQIASFQHKELCIEYKCGERRKECSVGSHNTPLLDLSEADCPSASASSRKDKSLRIMSQKFVMLFLVSTTKIITLDIAAKILIEESQDASDHSKFKTKVRRLYDIANVLTSLGLIKKVHVTEERGRKPAFKWIGPVNVTSDSGDQSMEVTATPSPDSKKVTSILFPASVNGKTRLTRHSSFNKVQSSDAVKRKVCSEPSTPHKTKKVYIESSDANSSKMAHLAAVCRQKIEEDSTCQTSVPKNMTHSGANVDPLPYSVVPVDSEYCVNHLVHRGPCVSQKGVKGQWTVMPASLSSTEHSNHGFLPNQPYMYLPSTSVFMLCGNLVEDNTFSVDEHCIRAGKTIEALERPGSAFPTFKQKSTSCPPEDDIPAKWQGTGIDDMPLSLVLPKRVLRSTDKSSEKLVLETTIPHKPMRLLPGEEDMDTDAKADGEKYMAENGDMSDLLKNNEPILQEDLKPAALQQYLYVPSAAGLNGFKFLLPTNQATGAVGLSPSPLTSLNVPCMVMPSSALAAFPFICSPAVTNSLPSASNGSGPSAGSMNFNLPGIVSATHVLIDTSAMVPSKSPEPSSDQPCTQSPVPGRCGSSVKVDPPACMGQPIPILKIQKSPTPLTPKSIRPVHQDTFFKTPGSLGVLSAFRKSEGTQTRNSSSAQRRLEISSSSGD